MKAFLLALCAAAIIAVGANFILAEIGFSSRETTSSPSVRLDHES